MVKSREKKTCVLSSTTGHISIRLHDGKISKTRTCAAIIKALDAVDDRKYGRICQACIGDGATRLRRQ